MQGEKQKQMEYIDGSVPILMKDYHEEGVLKKKGFPKADAPAIIPDSQVGLAKLKNNIDMEQKMDKRAKMLMAKAGDKKKEPQVKREYKKVTDEDRRIITRVFQRTHGKPVIQQLAKLLDVKDDTLRYYVRKLAKHESIERSKVKRGRHCILTKEGAGILYNLFNDNSVSSDKQAVTELSKRGIHVSRRTISRLLTNGFMEKMGYHSLTMQRVYFRGENAESPENKKARAEAAGLLYEYTCKDYHPVFIDETHWSVGWIWKRQRGRIGSKKLVSEKRRKYNVTSITSITEYGPGYTLVLEGNSITADMFYDYMCHLLGTVKNRKIVFFLDNAPIHKKKDLKQLVYSVKDKAIVFNAPYSPECNPIEKFFANWKRKVENRCDKIPTQKELVRIIEETFLTFSPDNCSDLINDMKREVWPKVVNMDDL